MTGPNFRFREGHSPDVDSQYPAPLFLRLLHRPVDQPHRACAEAGRDVAAGGEGSMSLQATHWESLSLETETFEPYGEYNGWLDIHVGTEKPVDENGKMVPYYGNRYWPTTIELTYYEKRVTDDVEMSHDLFSVAGLTAELARELAAKLIQAADRADSIDKPCCAPCGHWAPCDCTEAA